MARATCASASVSSSANAFFAASLALGYPGSYEPIVLVNVVVGQGAISLGIVWILSDGLVEIVDAFVKAFFGEFTRVIFAFEKQLVRFGISGRT